MIWLDGEYPALTGMKRADVAIVGGGLTGLMLAASLTRHGVRVVVLEGGRVGCGASGICSGTASVQLGALYERIESQAGLDAARHHADTLQDLLRIVAARQTALPEMQETSVYTFAFLPRDLPALEKQHALAQRLGLPASFAPDAGGCPFPVELSIMLRGQWMLPVSTLLDALSAQVVKQGGRIYEHSRVLELTGRRVYTASGGVEASAIVLATGMPIGLRKLALLSRLETRTLVSCHLSSLIPLHTCQQSVRPDGLSLRPVNGGAIAAWPLGRTGTKHQQARATLFDRILQGRLPDWTVGERRYAQDIWTADGLPLIGVIPGHKGRLLCATGYGGHGILGAMLAARVLTRRLLGQFAAEDALYQPDRPLRRQIQHQCIRRLVQIRTLNSLRRRAPACPHMGCRLRYSTATLRWECPFCGSVFSMLGTRISGPTLHSASLSALQRPDL
ncbi:MAG: FAD-dependent oxidoreductase [Clostridia bacterium]|nr:FAD-dependent oxidoreductase [Clostridia bacterium]